jgi:hypothetical protein
MAKSIRRIVVCMGLLVGLGLILPADAAAAGRGSGRGGGASRSSTNRRGPVAAQHGRSKPAPAARVGQFRPSVAVRRTPQVTPKQHVQGGPMSANAFWRAATSPNPPRTNGSSNVYWQKVQAQQQYQQRFNK